MKKLLFILICVVILSLFSCADKENNTQIEQFESSETMETVEIIETTDEPVPWSINITNDKARYDIGRVQPGDGFKFTIKRQSTENTNKFVITDSSGSLYEVIGGCDLNYDSLSFELSFANIGEFPMFTDSDYDYNDDYFGVFTQNRNIVNGERWYEDTPERRENLAKVFRIYINGELAGGELMSFQGNHTTYYYFMFDKFYSLEEMDTIHLELGYKEDLD